MAYEFKALIPDTVSPALFSQCVHAFILSNRYELEAFTSDEATVRYAGTPRRPSWPEDIRIANCPGSMLVSFHAPTRDERETCLRDIVQAFAAGGLKLSFEET